MFRILPPPPLQARSCLQCACSTFNSRAVGRIRTSRWSLNPAEFILKTRQVRHASTASPRGEPERKYFTFNSVWRRGINGAAVGGNAMGHRVITISSAAKDIPTSITNNSISSTTSETTPISTTAEAVNLDDVLPHRRRKLKKQLEETRQQQQSPEEVPLPLDASSRLSNAVENDPTTSFRRKAAAYLALSKPRLAALVTLTAMASYALYPATPHIPTIPESTTLSALTLFHLTVGTTLCIASANALNMLFETTHDAKMTRTRNRPLVKGLLTGRQALLFAILTGIAGVFVLADGVNPTVAGLGAANIWLYSFVYTPMKQISVANTWVGALVGAIPPLMGWAAAAGASTTTIAGRVEEGGDSGDVWSTAVKAGQASWEILTAHPGGLLLAAMLFAWQFPHFMAFSYMARQEYLRAGYKMLANTNPARNARVAVRYSVAFFPICVGLWYTGVTDGVFVIDSGIANAWLVYESLRFWKWKGEKGTARKLFWVSVWHLPVLMMLAMAHKKGLWQGVWRGLMGTSEEDEDGVDYLIEEDMD